MGKVKVKANTQYISVNCLHKWYNINCLMEHTGGTRLYNGDLIRTQTNKKLNLLTYNVLEIGMKEEMT